MLKHPTLAHSCPLPPDQLGRLDVLYDALRQRPHVEGEYLYKKYIPRSPVEGYFEVYTTKRTGVELVLPIRTVWQEWKISVVDAMQAILIDRPLDIHAQSIAREAVASLIDSSVIVGNGHCRQHSLARALELHLEKTSYVVEWLDARKNDVLVEMRLKHLQAIVPVELWESAPQWRGADLVTICLARVGGVAPR